MLDKEIPGMVPYNPRGSKEERAISGYAILRGWERIFPGSEHDVMGRRPAKDLLMFPKGVYKDTVDALVQAVLYLMDKPSQTGPPAEGSSGQHEQLLERKVRCKAMGMGNRNAANGSMIAGMGGFGCMIYNATGRPLKYEPGGREPPHCCGAGAD